MNEIIDDLIETQVCLPRLKNDQVTLYQCPLHVIIYPSFRPCVICEVYQQYSAFFQAIDKEAKYFGV